ncbi:MAG: hypothetical protein FJX54_00050 [Alphaproteobacteria bacterium]|nr:hypothetical protein [Alphaproteobacteria bacterium]
MIRVILLGALAFAWLAESAHAQGSSRILTTSNHPYWEVGALDADLSTECARGLFNQVQPNRLKVVFNGAIGPAILGVATSQYNLYDPKRRAKNDTSYFFFRDKTGACEVYRFAKGDEQKKQGALPMDFSPYRSVIEDSYKGWKTDESVKNRPPAAR